MPCALPRKIEPDSRGLVPAIHATPPEDDDGDGTVVSKALQSQIFSRLLPLASVRSAEPRGWPGQGRSSPAMTAKAENSQSSLSQQLTR
jgi:hypothetical protein